MARIIHLDTDEHRAAQAMLPWYVNGTLEPAELARMQAHLEQCTRCRADAQWEKRVRAAAPAAAAAQGNDVDRLWVALQRRLDPSGAGASRPRTAGDGLRAVWLPLAIALQAVILSAAAVAWLVAAPHEEPYRALGTAAPVTANVLLVFRPTATERDIRRVLRAHNAQLVGGPTATDAYLLHLDSLSPQALSRLQSDNTVLRVESLEAEAR